MIQKVIKRNGKKIPFEYSKIVNAISKAFIHCGILPLPEQYVIGRLNDYLPNSPIVSVEDIQDKVEQYLYRECPYQVAKAFTLYRDKHNRARDYVKKKKAFIANYKKSSNTANATIDDNSNVGNKNVGILNAEIHKEDNILLNRSIIKDKLQELYPDFDAKQYLKDLENHIIYKHDESSFAGPVPYCVSASMYPFLLNGLKDLGGKSTSPKNLDSFCGMYVNWIFSVSAMFAGAVATSEFLIYFDYFARKEWGDNYYINKDKVITLDCNRQKTIEYQIHQHFEQVIHSINQPSGARGLQSAFVNFSLFDVNFYTGMFENFVFPDGKRPQWESVKWLQKDFLHWFNQERLRTMLAFPVVSCTLQIDENKKPIDQDFFEFICEEYAQGNSFFTYISNSVDSLSSCCRLKNKIQTKEFSFTNGNMGIMTGSKSVITLNLNRIIQDTHKTYSEGNTTTFAEIKDYFLEDLQEILERVYKYHTAYNECLWDLYNADLLPVYKAGFIDLNKQYLTIGINGLNEAAEYLGIKCSDNEEYKQFCTTIFSFIKEQNLLHKTKKTTFNTECVPAESLGAKNYNWDKEDGYSVPENRNLYTSYIYLPSDETVDVLEKIRMHGDNFIGDYLDGGSACHINLEDHLTKEQYKKIILYACSVGCQYFTFNVPNCECEDCGFIAKKPFTECLKCHSTNVSLWDRVIGYFSKIKHWSLPRQIEQKTRVYAKIRGL